jgi:hypothetical protein
VPSFREAHVEVTLKDGRVLSADIAHAQGGPDRQLGDDEVAAKFLVQAKSVLHSEQAEQLQSLCFAIEDIADMRIVPKLLYAAEDADRLAAKSTVRGNQR